MKAAIKGQFIAQYLYQRITYIKKLALQCLHEEK